MTGAESQGLTVCYSWRIDGDAVFNTWWTCCSCENFETLKMTGQKWVSNFFSVSSSKYVTAVTVVCFLRPHIVKSFSAECNANCHASYYRPSYQLQLSASQTCKLTVFVVHWRGVFLISTRHIECIRGASCDDALYKLTFTFTFGYSFTWRHAACSGSVCHFVCVPKVLYTMSGAGLPAVSRSADFLVLHFREFNQIKQKFKTRNLAIANRSHMSCIHNTSRASMVTPWPWNLCQRSLKVIGKGTTR